MIGSGGSSTNVPKGNGGGGSFNSKGGVNDNGGGTIGYGGSSGTTIIEVGESTDSTAGGKGFGGKSYGGGTNIGGGSSGITTVTGGEESSGGAASGGGVNGGSGSTGITNVYEGGGKPSGGETGGVGGPTVITVPGGGYGGYGGGGGAEFGGEGGSGGSVTIPGGGENGKFVDGTSFPIGGAGPISLFNGSNGAINIIINSNSESNSQWSGGHNHPFVDTGGRGGQGSGVMVDLGYEILQCKINDDCLDVGTHYSCIRQRCIIEHCSSDDECPDRRRLDFLRRRSHLRLSRVSNHLPFLRL